MNCNRENSSVVILLQSLAKIWVPAMKALELKQNLGTCSLAESQGAAERAGCAVCYADLPAKVSGVAAMIDDRRYIVLNRNKPLQNLKYTLPHELAHHVLHLNAARSDDERGFPAKGMEELEAHLFAAAWVLATTNHKEREEVLQHNPEAGFILMSWVMVSLGGVGIALVGYICQKLFGARPSNSEIGK